MKSLLAPLTVGLIHGRLPAEEKEAVMTQFREGRLSALVATTVIEIGVDVPNANILVVENAERFGPGPVASTPRAYRPRRIQILLHLAARSQSRETAREKLATLEATSDGFLVAEAVASARTRRSDRDGSNRPSAFAAGRPFSRRCRSHA